MIRWHFQLRMRKATRSISRPPSSCWWDASPWQGCPSSKFAGYYESKKARKQLATKPARVKTQAARTGGQRTNTSDLLFFPQISVEWQTGVSCLRKLAYNHWFRGTHSGLDQKVLVFEPTGYITETSNSHSLLSHNFPTREHSRPHSPFRFS